MEHPPAEEQDTPGARRRFRRQLVGLFLVALALRLGYQAEMWSNPLLSVPFGGGAFTHAWGVALSEGRDAPEVYYHAPLYPYLLGLLYRTFGPDPALVRVLQALLGAATCVLLALTGTGFVSRRAGLVAGALLAVYPFAILTEGVIKKTAIALFLLTLVLALLARARTRPSGRGFLGAGLALGLAAITRENTLVLAPLVLAWIWISFATSERPARAARVRWCLVFAAGLLAAPLAVAVRNQIVGGELVFGTTNSGANFYIGNHARADGLFEPLVRGHGSAIHDRRDARRLAEADLGRPLEAREVSRYWRDRALSDIAADPLRWLTLLARKTRYLVSAREWSDDYNLEPFRDDSLVLRVLGVPFRYGVVATLALAGLFVAPRRAWLLHGTLVALAASIVLFFVVARFRLSLLPPLLVFAACALVELARRARARDAAATARLALGIVAAAALVHWPVGVEEWPRSATYTFLGRALVEEGRAEEGLAWFERAIRVRPENDAAHLRAGETLFELGRYEEGIERLNEAVRLQPDHLDDAGLHYAFGLTLRRLGRLDEAEAAYREALRLRPDHADARNNLGYLLALRGRPEEAIAQYEAAIAADPEFARPRVNLAWLLATHPRLRRGGEALRHARRAQELAGDDARVLETLAAAYAATGEFDAAVRVAERLHARFVEDGDAPGARRIEQRLADYRAGRMTTDAGG